MKSFLSNAFVILISVITVGYSSTLICKPLTQCPPLLAMIETKPNHKGTIQFLRSRHCGFDGRMPKVWCDNSNFINFTCKTPNLLEGTCTSIKNCKYMVDLLKSLDLNNANTRAFILGHKCDNVNNGNVNVCCPKKNMEIRELLPNSDQCGIPNPRPLRCSTCAVGAMETFVGRHPWMALLHFRKVNNRVYPGCGGSLISKKFVLTAAHCLDKHIWSTLNIQNLEHIALGEFDVNKDPDCHYGICADPVKNVLGENIYIHHQWNRHTIKNDIALIRLKEMVTFTDFIMPICLPKPGSNLMIKEFVQITGWGKTETGETIFRRSSPVLLKAYLHIVDRSKCSFSRRQLSSGQLCIGGPNGTDSCEGDSGGPVTNIGPPYYVYGIVSYGRECGKYPAVYTYVVKYLDWIHEIIQNDIIFSG